MEKQWWHGKVAYQIYPKSFCDTNGDGIGDLPGIIGKLDYLKALGVDILWLSPIYPSPFVDQGYDIADYYGIAAQFGTMADMEQLLAEARRRDMYVLMDLVVNHCSSQHPWFQKALADPYGPYADYFYFRKGKAGGPPSNYRGYFGTPAWDPVPGTDLYYLHYFAKEQPDLNWENPALREEVYKMIRWWMDKGLAGFRIDAIMNIKKDLTFADLPADGPDGLASVWRVVEAVDGVEQLLAGLRDNAFAPTNAFTVGEVFNMQPDALARFIGDGGYFSTMFDFSGETMAKGSDGWYNTPPFSWDAWRDGMLAQQARCEGVCMMANIVENHDEPRGASRYLPAFAQNPAGQKLLGTVSVLLRGLPFIYQGQELGMTNCPMDSIDEYNDINTKGEYALALAHGLTEAQALAVCQANSRDNARTPMQWTDGPNAGFTTGKPWFKVNPNYRTVNAAAQLADPDSVLHYYRRLIALRKDPRWLDVFAWGATRPVEPRQPGLFAYERVLDGRRVLVAGNCAENPATIALPGLPGTLLLDNLPGAPQTGAGTLTLRPLEAAVIALAD